MWSALIVPLHRCFGRPRPLLPPTLSIGNEGRGKQRAWLTEITVERHNQSWPLLARSRPKWRKWPSKMEKFGSPKG